MLKDRLQNKSLLDTVCSMNDFFKATGQLLIWIFILSLFLLVFLVSLPFYLTWYAEQSIVRSDAKGMSELTRKTVEAQFIVEKAILESQAMLILAEGQNESADARSRYIRTIGDAARRYPAYANDEYLMSLSSAISSGNFPYNLDAINTD